MTTLHGPASALSPIERYLHALHEKHRAHGAGKVADYIPELSHADPHWFGICIATPEGHVYEVGDTRQAFTIQSISKALVYGLALQDRGETDVLAHVGVEPSGDAFNAISLHPERGTPLNPMINAGAIATSGLVHADPGRGRIGRIVDFLSACAGRTLEVDEAVYASESATGHRNRAIGWMLRNASVLDGDPTDVLETYFRQCAVRVTCRDLALMGATLANHGRHPLTGAQAIAPGHVDKVLSVMATCGMYDFSGEWLYRIGLPAKSGVGGGILAVLPGQLGIGLFSPPLDAQGNSERGIRVCADLSRDLALHLFHDGALAVPALRLAYDCAQVHSRRRRPAWAREWLAREGGRARVLELQGELVFGTVEPVLRRVHAQASGAAAYLLDLRNVLGADAASLRLLAQLQQSLRGRGVALLASHAGPLADPLAGQGFDTASLCADTDRGLERMEDLLLSELPAPASATAGGTLADCELLAGLSEDEIAWLERHTEALAVPSGAAVVRAGEPGDALLFLLQGCVEVRLGDASRIDVFTAGMSFGEMAFIDGAPRSADVIAVEPVACRALHVRTFERMDGEQPQLKIQLLQRITRQLSANLRRINAEVLAYRA